MRSHKLTWGDVLSAPGRMQHGTDRETVLRCLACPGVLTDWGTEFLRSLLARQRPLTRKQRKILADIFEKVTAFEAARTAA